MDPETEGTTPGKHILNLSDEILLLLVSYIDIEDIINLASTCTRFDNLLQDKSICRKIVIPWNTIVHRRGLTTFLGQPNRATIITHLKLNDVYWIPSYFIRDVVIRLNSLKELHVAGTPLSWNHLSQILSNPTTMLEALSWTWDDDLEGLVRPRRDKRPALPMETIWSELLAVRDKLLLLRSLVIHIPDSFNSTRLIVTSYCALCFLISLCTNLEELRIFSAPKTINERKHSLIYRKEVFHPEMKFPKLHTFVLSALEPPKIFLPQLLVQVLNSFQRKQQPASDTEKQLEESPGSLVRNLWIDHSWLNLNGSRGGIPNASIDWSTPNMKSVEYFSLPLTEEVLRSFQSSDLRNVKHLLVTLGSSRVISLNKLLQEATGLETFCSKAFNYKLDWKQFIHSHPQLTTINVCDVNPSEENLLSYPEACVEMGRLQNLRKLSLPINCLLEIKSEPACADYFQKLAESGDRTTGNRIPLADDHFSNDLLFKSKRVSRREVPRQNSNSISGLNYLTVHCPEVDEFEIGFTERQVGGKLSVGSLSSIGRWSHLKRLALDTLPILSGQFLIDIAQGTVSLERLRIRDLGPSGKCIYINELCAALKYWKKLKDFRFEQKYIGSMERLCQSLQSCQQLERFCIYVTANDRPLEPSGFLHLMEYCKRLFVLYLTLGSATKTSCVQLRKKLETLYKVSRPPLSLVIQNKMDEDVVQFHSIHYREMVTNSSQVGAYQSFSFP